MISFLIISVFAYWVIFREGAEYIEHKAHSAFLLSPLAPALTAPLLRLYVGALWCLRLVLMIVNETAR